MALAVDSVPSVRRLPGWPTAHPHELPQTLVVPARRLECADPDDDEEDELGDEEDLSVAQPLADEESNFDDFDDEFDDDFEEDGNDPDWDHPDDADGEEPPAGKGPTRRK